MNESNVLNNPPPPPRVEEEPEELKNEVNAPPPRPRFHYYYSWRLTRTAAPRSHRADRRESVGMSAGGADGTAGRPAGRSRRSGRCFIPCHLLPNLGPIPNRRKPV